MPDTEEDPRSTRCFGRLVNEVGRHFSVTLPGLIRPNQVHESLLDLLLAEVLEVLMGHELGDKAAEPSRPINVENQKTG